MKLKELIARVNKSKEFTEEVDVYYIAEKMNLDLLGYGYIISKRLISYVVGSWQCTDTCVGYIVYYFDNVPVAISTQLYRKQKEEFEWVSKESYKKVKEYLLTYVLEEDVQIKFADLDKEVGEYYKIDYNSQLYNYHLNIALYNGNKVKIIKYPTKSATSHFITESKVKILNGDKEELIDIKELDFPYNII